MPGPRIKKPVYHQYVVAEWPTNEKPCHPHVVFGADTLEECQATLRAYSKVDLAIQRPTVMERSPNGRLIRV